MKKLKVYFLLLATQSALSAKIIQHDKLMKPIQENKKIVNGSISKNSIDLYRKLKHKNYHEKYLKTVPLSLKYSPINCDTIKCPKEESPVCAKITFKHKKSSPKDKQVFVLMINQCEMNYSKCHREMEAVVVPMENCHLNFDKTSTGKRRSKRQVTEPDPDHNEPEQNYEDLPTVDEPILEGDSTLFDPSVGDYQFEPNPAPIIATVVEDLDNFVEEMTSAETNENEKDNKYDDNNAGNDADKHNDVVGDPYDDKGQGEDYFNAGRAENEEKVDDILDVAHESNEANHFGVHYDEVNQEQYKAVCPTQCPSRDVMVCALCDHGIYKTFLSVCHMRMFQCRHKDETVQLVSRYPCMMSAPYLSDEPDMKPKGRVMEPSDHDPVIRYARCRESGKLGKTPKCSFDDQDIMLNEDIKEELPPHENHY